MLVAFFTIWVSILPLIVWQGSFEGIKVLWFFGGATGLTIFWIWCILIQKKDFVFLKSDAFYLLWLTVLLISSLFGVHPFESVIGGSYRHQGVIFFLGLMLIKKTFEILKVDEKKVLYKGVGLAVIIESLIILYQVVFGKLYLGKPLGTIGEAGAVAGFLAMGSYFVITSFPKISLIIPAISIALTQSRAGVLAFAAFFLFLINLINKKRRTLLLGLIALSVGTLVLYFSLGKGTSFFENRPIIWRLGTTEILQRPVLGYGAESGEVIYSRAFAKENVPLFGLIIDRAHNLLLDVTMWSGAVGLIVFCFWLYYSFKDLKETLKKFAFVSFLIYAMLQPLSVVHWVLFFLII